MKRGLAISFAALTLLFSIPTEAGAAGAGSGQTCGGFVGTTCNRGLFCQARAYSPMGRAPVSEYRGSVHRS